MSIEHIIIGGLVVVVVILGAKILGFMFGGWNA
jgi:hypothetical protein